MTNEQRLSDALSDLRYRHGLLKAEATELRRENARLSSEVGALREEIAELRGSLKEGWVSPKTHRRAIKRYQELNQLYMKTAAELFDLKGDLKL